MEILTFSQKRGITALFQGYGKHTYVFHSNYYGCVGYANIDRSQCGKDTVEVNVFLPSGCRDWYWSLCNIVKRGICKAERRYVKIKQIVFNVSYLSIEDDAGNQHEVDSVGNIEADIYLNEGIVEEVTQ